MPACDASDRSETKKKKTWAKRNSLHPHKNPLCIVIGTEPDYYCLYWFRILMHTASQSNATHVYIAKAYTVPLALGMFADRIVPSRTLFYVNPNSCSFNAFSASEQILAGYQLTMFACRGARMFQCIGCSGCSCEADDEFAVPTASVRLNLRLRIFAFRWRPWPIAADEYQFSNPSH